MALENWTVIFDRTAAGTGLQVPFANQTEATGGKVQTVEATVATISAGSAQEACTAARKAYGESLVNGKMLVVKTSSLEELSG
jgi:hypothetical protein